MLDGITNKQKGVFNIATQKQLYFVNGLIGKAIVNDKVLNKRDLWNRLDLLNDTKLEDLDNKQMSNVISKLNEINNDIE